MTTPQISPLVAPSTAPESGPDLRLLPGAGRGRATALLSAAVAVGSILAVIAAQLLISLLITHGAYTVSSLQNRQTRLQRDYQVTTEAVARDSSPQNLAAKAHALGMVSTSSLAYLRLSDAAILGTPHAAGKVAPGSVQATSLVPDALLPGLDGTKPQKAKPDTGPKGTTSQASTPTSVFTGTLPSPVTR